MTTLTLLAICLMLEAGGESYQGKLAVASVIWNRAEGKAVRVEAVLIKRRQFSCLNNGQAHAAASVDRMIMGQGGTEVWRDCLLIAGEIMDGTFQPTVEASHYYNPSKASPSWGKALRGKVTVGSHVFGSLK